MISFDMKFYKALPFFKPLRPFLRGNDFVHNPLFNNKENFISFDIQFYKDPPLFKLLLPFLRGNDFVHILFPLFIIKKTLYLLICNFIKPHPCLSPRVNFLQEKWFCPQIIPTLHNKENFISFDMQFYKAPPLFLSPWVPPYFTGKMFCPHIIPTFYNKENWRGPL
jgi:hypothetical protein